MSKRVYLIVCGAGLTAILFPAALVAGEQTDAVAMELFEKHVRPTLLEHCLRCHGEHRQRGGLRLDSRDGWTAGGDSGPAIVPGKPDQSRLINAIRYQNAELEMPPKGVLPAKTIKAFETWVALGAPDPRASVANDRPQEQDTSPSIAQGREFWSFQPIDRPPAPPVGDQQWPRTDIDRFVLAGMQQHQLQPTSDADRTTLARRVYFDLLGLPPTPEQLSEFENDPAPDAYERLIDRLLDSPHFGERWGRHWLDVVRFAQSSGGGRTLLFPNAWRYRDYVIDALNNDMPYDQFLAEQIAGDLLDHRDWNDRRRKLIATAFLLLGPTNYELQDKDILEMDVVDEQLDTIGKSMLGMTIGCARCHDHKFDPIPTRDYYAMAGILRSTRAMIHENVSKWNTVELPVSPDHQAEIEDYQRRIDQIESDLESARQSWKAAGGVPKPDKSTAKKSIDPNSIRGVVVDDTQVERVGTWTESTSIGGFVGSRYLHDAGADRGSKRLIYRPQLPQAGQYEVRISYTASSNRSARVPVVVHHRGGMRVIKIDQTKQPPLPNSLISLGRFEFDPASRTQVVITNDGTSDGVVIADAVVFLADDEPPKSTAESEPEIQQPAGATKAAEQAELAKLKSEVDRLSKQLKRLQASAPARPIAMATIDDSDAGDIQLAIRGVVHNRGDVVPRGVLQVASDAPFPPIPVGQSGRRELAYWITSERNPLTARVMANRVWYWLIGRGIVPSVDNFGDTGDRPTHPLLLDHLASQLIDNGWSVKSLIRQIMTSRVYQMSTEQDPLASQIDAHNRWLWRMNRKRLRAEDIRDALLLVSGQLDLSAGGPNIASGTNSEYGYEFVSRRRSVYVPVFRNTLPEVFEVFDFADPNIQRGLRTTSTIASQALLLMNHPTVIERSRQAAEQLLGGDDLGTTERIQLAYQQVLGRSPTAEELPIAVDFVGQGGQDSDPLDRWAMLYQALFQCIDFRYLN